MRSKPHGDNVKTGSGMEGERTKGIAATPALGGSEAARGIPYELGFAERLRRLGTKPYLDVHVADHCNLRCAGCLHFAPVADPRLLYLEEVEAFRRRAHPMCRHCDNGRLSVAPWGRSKRERDEWFAD